MKRILGTYMFPLKQFVCDCCEKESAVTSSKSSKLPAGWIEVNEKHYCAACVKRDQQIREAATIASKKFRYRGMHITAMSGFIEGAKWADNHSKHTWISVEEMLPNVNKCGESKMVFVRVINKDTKAEWIEQPAKYNINIKDWIAMDFTHIGKRNGIVTHWMAIPKLKEDKI